MKVGESYQRFQRQIITPHWVSKPENFLWGSPSGQLQGPGTIAYSQPGMFNLCWLALDKKIPAHGYDGAKNYLLVWVLGSVHMFRIGKRSLEEIAAMSTLSEFCKLVADCKVPEVRLLMQAGLKQ